MKKARILRIIKASYRHDTEKTKPAHCERRQVVAGERKGWSNNIKTKDFPLFSEKSHFTDDSVMTLAVAKAVMDTRDKDNDEELKAAIIKSKRY